MRTPRAPKGAPNGQPASRAVRPKSTERTVSNVIARVRQLKTDKRGIAALEYVLLAAFVAFAIVAGAATFGISVKNYSNNLGNTVNNMNSSAPANNN